MPGRRESWSEHPWSPQRPPCWSWGWSGGRAEAAGLSCSWSRGWIPQPFGKNQSQHFYLFFIFFKSSVFDESCVNSFNFFRHISPRLEQSSCRVDTSTPQWWATLGGLSRITQPKLLNIINIKTIDFIYLDLTYKGYVNWKIHICCKRKITAFTWENDFCNLYSKCWDIFFW